MLFNTFPLLTTAGVNYVIFFMSLLISQNAFSQVLPTQKEIQAAWKDNRNKSYKFTSYTTTVEYRLKAQGVQRSSSWNIVRVDDHNCSIESKPTEYVACLNTKYAFVIRHDAKKNTSLIDKLSIGAPFAKDCIYQMVIRNPTMLNLVFPESSVNRVCLLGVLDGQDIVLETIELYGDSYSAKFVANITTADKSPSEHFVVKCILNGGDFRIMSLESEMFRNNKSLGVDSCKIIYDTIDGIYLPSRIEYSTNMIEGYSTFTNYNTQRLPLERFTLSHYAFPEPEGVVWEKPIPSYVWYLSIAGGALVLFFLAGWLLKRRARARAAAATTSAPPKPPAG